MKPKIFIPILIVFIYSCKSKPTYNAFDNVFNVSIKEVVKNGCDTISAGCGWFNLTEKEGRLRNYYQVYENQIDAKGFIFFLDTLQLNDLKQCEKLNIDSLPISINSTEALNTELEKYGFEFLSHQLNNETNMHEVRITDESETNVFTLHIEHEIIKNDSLMLIRSLNYYKPYKR